MVVRNEFSDSRGISAIPSYALKSSKPILIRTDKGLVPLKVDVNSQSCEEQKHESVMNVFSVAYYVDHLRVASP